MKNKEIKKLSIDELKNKVNSLKKDLFNFRFRKVNGQLESAAKVSQIKKDVAKLLTALNQKNWYEQKKISKLTRLMRYPCSDALSYCQLSEGKLDVVLQCYNKIWDIHPMIPLIKNAGGYITTW